MANQLFKLIELSPIGFKKPYYPVQHCSLCRGYLNDVCNTCMEKKCDKCDVINSDGTYYHRHCHTFMNQKPVAKKCAKKYETDSD